MGNIINKTCAVILVNTRYCRTTQTIYDELGNTVQQTDAMGGITSQKWNIFGELVEVTNANGHTHRFTYDANSNLIEENNPSSGITQYEYDAANQLIQKVNAKGDKTTYQYDLAGKLTTEITTATGSATPSQIVTYLYNDAGQLVDVKQTGATSSRYQYSMDALGRTTEETVTYGTGSEAITKKLGYGYDQENRLSSFQYPEGSELQYHYDKANLKSTQLANGESIEWAKYQWFSPTEINTPNVKQQNQYDALMRPTTISVSNQQNTALMKRDYQYNVAGNIISRNTEKGKVDYRYDQLDRLIEATPDTSLQAIGLPNEGYTYDAIGNRLGSRHQPGSWQYNGQDQLMSWGTGSQAETLSYTATGQLKQNKKTLETLDYDYDATDRLTEVKRNDITLANYQYDPFGRRMSKEVNGERTYFLYSDEGLIAELNDRGNTQVAYGWLPDSTWGTNPLWQANLATGQTLKNAAYHYLHTDHLGTPQIATNQAGNITWQAEAEVFGETHLNESNQITMNLRFPGQYYDAETESHYNYFRDYNPRTGRYQQSDPIGLLGGINHYGYGYANSLRYYDPTGEAVPLIVWWLGGAVVGMLVDEVVSIGKEMYCSKDCDSYELPSGQGGNKVVAAGVGAGFGHYVGEYGPVLNKKKEGFTGAVGGSGDKQPTPRTSRHSVKVLKASTTGTITKQEARVLRDKGRRMLGRRLPYIGTFFTGYELMNFFDC